MPKKIEGKIKQIARIMKVADLRPMEDNPRRPIAEAMESLRDSIERFGLDGGAPCAVQPIVVNTHPEARNTIISGHRRWEAVSEYGFAEVWTIPVRLAPDEAKELAIRMNVPAGDWDWELLEPFAEDLADWGFTSIDFGGNGGAPTGFEFSTLTSEEARSLTGLASEAMGREVDAAEVQSIALQRFHDDLEARRRAASSSVTEVDRVDHGDAVQEINPGEFEFDHECPRCQFRF